MKPTLLAFNCLVVVVCVGLAVVSADSSNSNEQSNMCSFSPRAHDTFITDGNKLSSEMLTEEECERKCCDARDECQFMSFKHVVDGVDQPGVDQPGVDQPGVDQPGVDRVGHQGECVLWTRVSNVGVVDHSSTRKKLDSVKEAACLYASRLRHVFYPPNGNELMSKTGLITDEECEDLCCEKSECVFYSFMYNRYQGEECVLWSETPSDVGPTYEVDGWSRYKIGEDSLVEGPQSEGSLLEEEPSCEWDSHSFVRYTNGTELLREVTNEQECRTWCCEREDCLAFSHGHTNDVPSQIELCVLWSSLRDPVSDDKWNTFFKRSEDSLVEDPQSEGSLLEDTFNPDCSFNPPQQLAYTGTELSVTRATQSECEEECCAHETCLYYTHRHSSYSEVAPNVCILYSDVNGSVHDQHTTVSKSRIVTLPVCSYRTTQGSVYTSGTSVAQFPGLMSHQECEMECCQEVKCRFYSLKKGPAGTWCELWSEVESSEPANPSWSGEKLVPFPPMCELAQPIKQLWPADGAEIKAVSAMTEAECQRECCQLDNCAVMAFMDVPFSFTKCSLWRHVSHYESSSAMETTYIQEKENFVWDLCLFDDPLQVERMNRIVLGDFSGVTEEQCENNCCENSECKVIGFRPSEEEEGSLLVSGEEEGSLLASTGNCTLFGERFLLTSAPIPDENTMRFRERIGRADPHNLLASVQPPSLRLQKHLQDIENARRVDKDSCIYSETAEGVLVTEGREVWRMNELGERACERKCCQMSNCTFMSYEETEFRGDCRLWESVDAVSIDEFSVTRIKGNAIPGLLNDLIQESLNQVDLEVIPDVIPESVAEPYIVPQAPSPSRSISFWGSQADCNLPLVFTSPLPLPPIDLITLHMKKLHEEEVESVSVKKHFSVVFSEGDSVTLTRTEHCGEWPDWMLDVELIQLA